MLSANDTMGCENRLSSVNERERWRGHPHFEWAATFVERYDQAAIDPPAACAPLSEFEPRVMRLFARTPRVRPLP